MTGCGRRIPATVSTKNRPEVDNCHVTDYIWCMILTFADRTTEDFFVTGSSRRLPPELLKRALRKLEYIHHAAALDDLRSPPGNRLHALAGSRAGQHAIAVNEQWRTCFRFVDGDAYDVELTDYH